MINCSPLDIRRGDYCAWFCARRAYIRGYSSVRDMDIRHDLRNCVYRSKFCGKIASEVRRCSWVKNSLTLVDLFG